jgi:hypothetical protein
VESAELQKFTPDKDAFKTCEGPRGIRTIVEGIREMELGQRIEVAEKTPVLVLSGDLDLIVVQN